MLHSLLCKSQIKKHEPDKDYFLLTNKVDTVIKCESSHLTICQEIKKSLAELSKASLLSN
jgi:hypothetical protein